ncbi:hypothetical protein B0H13DRAFT_803740 [Mycena leptocephala]|nr:hypothetical protein B0H13DRAFT_803740 [Mycena leptocephala]
MAPDYPTGRRACLAGYRDLPTLDTTMTFDLLQLPRVTSRLVRIENRSFELWSPNSLQIPFLPGLRSSSFRPGISTDPRERRYDGHAGKHDPIHAPQYWLADTVHWPMMRRAENILPDDPRREAFLPLTTQWLEGASGGRIRSTFVGRLSAIRRDLEAEVKALRPMLYPFPGAYSSRPNNPTFDQVERLRNISTWEEAVDRGVAVQRDLREKEAWIAWWHERIRQRASEFSLTRLREVDMPRADDQYIGLWVNGAPEEVVLRYLAASIPCFVVHEFKGLVDGLEESDVQQREDFLQGTTLETLLGDDNPYQRIARQQVLLDSMSGTDDGRLWTQPRGSVEDEMRSSSAHLVSLVQARLASLAPAPSPAITSVDPPAPPAATILSSSDVILPPRDLQGLSRVPDAAVDKFAAPKLIMRVIDASRVPWMVPPPIAAQHKSRYEKWALTDLDGSRAWVCQGKGRKERYVNEWFDRELGRRLCFGRFTEPPGVVNSRRFGAPVPRFPFYHPGDGVHALPRKASYWMYRTEKEVQGDAGMESSTPHPDELPRLMEVAAGAGRGKGKMVVQHGEESFEPDDSEEDSDELEGMTVDDPEDEEIPTKVVVLDGLDRNVSAVMFYSLSRDHLAGGITPSCIINAQGRMWIRFSDVSMGRRAFGALSGFSPGSVRTFASDNAFGDAAQYTQDIWSAELLADQAEPRDEEMPERPRHPPEDAQELHAAESSPASAPSQPEQGNLRALPTPPLERLGGERVEEVGAATVPVPDASTQPESGNQPASAPLPERPHGQQVGTRIDVAIQTKMVTEVAPYPSHQPENATTRNPKPVGEAPTAPLAMQETLPARITKRLPPAPRSGQNLISLIPLLLRLSDPKPSLESRLSGPDLAPRKAESRATKAISSNPQPFGSPLVLEGLGNQQSRPRNPPPVQDNSGAQRLKRRESPDADGSDPPVKKKARRGKRSGRIVKEKGRIRDAWRAEQVNLMEEAMGGDSLLEFVQAMDVGAEAEIAGLTENGEIPMWDHEPDEDMPVAGPSH